jgi:serine protease
LLTLYVTFQFGVAKGADIIAVKILDARGRGTYAGMIAGLDFVAGEKKVSPEQPMVINLSVAGPKSRLANKAVDNAVDLGIVVVVAAGNYDKNACRNYSPASAEKVITVGASELSGLNNEMRALYSNYGVCIDVFA